MYIHHAPALSGKDNVAPSIKYNFSQSRMGLGSGHYFSLGGPAPKKYFHSQIFY